MAVVTLLSDFVDGTCMALSEDTNAKDLNTYMAQAPGHLWAGVQQRRRARGLTRERRGPGTLYFAATEAEHALVTAYLQSDTGSDQESQCLEGLRAAGIEMAPHVGEAAERHVLLNGQQKALTRQAQAKGFG
ncbi:MAG: hypothetical protein VKK03_07610 [Synechococcus sp.]|nr:hypothetical protein [Synechococcus sp.]